MQAAVAWTQNASAWIGRAFASRRVQLTVTALVSGVFVAGTIFAYQTSSRKRRMKRLKLSLDPDLEDHDVIADLISDYKDQVAQKDRLHGVSQSTQALTNGGPAERDSSIRSNIIVTETEEERHNVALAKRAREGDYDNDLILEQLARNRVFLTDEGLEKLRSAFVIVVGCGGVGSHAAAALARSGVSKLRLIDFDQVTLSSLNRHAVATLADVGTPKVHCIRKRLEQVTPWVHFDCRNQLFKNESANLQLASWNGQQPDYVVDAIDNVDSKVELLNFCHSKDIPVISSMGAGCKSDPTRVFVGDISTSIEDPLSRSTRRRLKILGVSTGIPVVFSTEKATPGKAQLLPLPEDEFEKGKVGELGVLPDFRVRILPVLGTMPAIFGLCVANHIMLEITGYPHEYLQSKSREKMYDGILANLQGLEERLAKSAGEEAIGLRIPVKQDDVSYLIEEIFRGRSVVSGLPTRLALIRWDRPGPQASLIDKSYDGQKYSKFKLTDLVCMTKEEAAVHEKEVLRGENSPEDVYDSSVVRLVAQRAAEVSLYEAFRNTKNPWAQSKTCCFENLPTPSLWGTRLHAESGELGAA